MTDETSRTPQQGGRPGGNREPGGFRIRLSDNEMRAARALQEAFRLRSTVAVLGFSVRALGQMLEEGKLDELIAQQRSQPDGRPPRGEDRDRGPRPERKPRVDPFARPSRPAPVVEQEEPVAEAAAMEPDQNDPDRTEAPDDEPVEASTQAGPAEEIPPSDQPSPAAEADLTAGTAAVEEA